MPTEKTFTSYLSAIDFLSYFDKRLLPKKGGGRDHMSPSSYRNLFIKETDWIKDKLITGDYRFSAYQEKLILKGKGKLPRVLSIPTIRDRFVLSILNDYLTNQLELKHEAPNRYIYNITVYMNENKDNPLYFLKTDISSFYDSINHSVLIKQLSEKIDSVALKLILDAITTPTISNSIDCNKINLVGVPQGLSISNILAAVYMNKCHQSLKKALEPGLFLRYVDDILVLTPEQVDIRSIINNHIARYNLGLKLTEAKTQSGEINVDEFDYIGYKIAGNKISIKQANRDKFTNRVIRRCFQANRQYDDALLRPRFIKDNQEFIEYTEADLNLLISGFRVTNHNYGWIAYFQQMTDLEILYQIDALIKKSLGTKLYGKLNINSIVRTYYDIRNNGGRSILIDFDKITERGERIAYLLKFGYLRKSETEDISDNEIDRKFNSLVKHFVKKSEMDIRELS